MYFPGWIWRSLFHKPARQYAQSFMRRAESRCCSLWTCLPGSDSDLSLVLNCCSQKLLSVLPNLRPEAPVCTSLKDDGVVNPNRPVTLTCPPASTVTLLERCSKMFLPGAPGGEWFNKRTELRVFDLYPERQPDQLQNNWTAMKTMLWHHLTSLSLRHTHKVSDTLTHTCGRSVQLHSYNECTDSMLSPFRDLAALHEWLKYRNGRAPKPTQLTDQT